MEPTNPIERVRARRAEASARYKAEHEAKERNEGERSLSFYFEAERQFLEYIRENDYPHAELMNMEGKTYIAYNLFDLETSHIEFEVHFPESRALYLLIDENETFSYGKETMHSGRAEYLYKPTPKPFVLPPTYDELVEYKAKAGFSDQMSHFDYQKLAANLIYKLNHYSQAPVKIGDHIFRHDREITITEGFTIETEVRDALESE